MNGHVMTLHDSGDNAKGLTVTVKVNLFNSLGQNEGNRSWCKTKTLPVGSTIKDLIDALGLRREHIYKIMRNGRDVTSRHIGDIMS